MLTAAKVNQFYGGSHTLWDVDLDVEKGDCVCLMGRNGVGKTTLLKVIMGLLPTVSGKISFGDTQLTGAAPEARAHAGIGYVPQGREIFPFLTVEENLRIGRGRQGTHDEIPERVLKLFPVLKEMLRRRGGDLSGGQQQQLAMGRALALDPQLLILDEPTEGIQPNVVREIGDVIIQLVDEGMTVLLVEQKLAFARRIGRSFRILDRGKVVAGGGIGDLTDDLVRRHLTV
ncbi:MAG TPA: urea ABC transporter ATP-binding subunit UrtE [Polyangia bacterium]|nr:urea ABC transporter ATP-binding subunit UrtE [Polyangia bacterium]